MYQKTIEKEVEEMKRIQKEIYKIENPEMRNWDIYVVLVKFF